MTDRDLKVLVYPADHGGCGFYRMVAPARACRDAGADVTLIEGKHTLTEGGPVPSDEPAQIKMIVRDELRTDTRTGRTIPWPHGLKIIDGEPALEADVVVLQRPMQSLLLDVIRGLQSEGVAVVVELDDDFKHLHHANAAFRVTHPTRSDYRNWHHLVAACRMADLVTCTTPALAKLYAGHGRVAVLPNLVPAWYTELPAPIRDDDSHVTVGWSGTVATHPDDLQQTRGAVGRALGRRPGSRFHTIGQEAGVQAALRLPDSVPYSATGWLPLADYPAALQALDVGIVPLQPSAFNEAKSWLKGLEMAAVGVPFVASPTSPYRELHRRFGLGVLAESPREWERAVGSFLDSAATREIHGERGRIICAGLTYETHHGLWLDAWRQAYEYRKNLSPAA